MNMKFYNVIGPAFMTFCHAQLPEHFRLERSRFANDALFYSVSHRESWPPEVASPGHIMQRRRERQLHMRGTATPKMTTTIICAGVVQITQVVQTMKEGIISQTVKEGIRQTLLCSILQGGSGGVCMSSSVIHTFWFSTPKIKQQRATNGLNNSSNNKKKCKSQNETCYFYKIMKS